MFFLQKNMFHIAHFLKTKNYKPINGKHMFLQGSPKLDKKNGVFIGRLSGISAHYIPKLFLNNIDHVVSNSVFTKNLANSLGFASKILQIHALSLHFSWQIHTFSFASLYIFLASS